MSEELEKVIQTALREVLQDLTQKYVQAYIATTHMARCEPDEFHVAIAQGDTTCELKMKFHKYENHEQAVEECKKLSEERQKEKIQEAVNKSVFTKEE